MTCRHVAQLKDVYLDGELSPSLTAEVHAHLLQCPECQEQFEMIRASAEVIAKDQPEPTLASGFAMRVLAAMPKPEADGEQSRPQTRREARKKFWRIVFAGSLPAAAAVLFFSVLIWPANETTGPNGLVLGESVDATQATGLKTVTTPALDAVARTGHAAESLNQFLKLSVEEARHRVDAAVGKDGALPRITLTDIIFAPFRDFLKPVEESDVAPPDRPEIVRF